MWLCYYQVEKNSSKPRSSVEDYISAIEVSTTVEICTIIWYQIWEPLFQNSDKNKKESVFTLSLHCDFYSKWVSDVVASLQLTSLDSWLSELTAVTMVTETTSSSTWTLTLSCPRQSWRWPLSTLYPSWLQLCRKTCLGLWAWVEYRERPSLGKYWYIKYKNNQ